jgi:serine protease Do
LEHGDIITAVEGRQGGTAQQLRGEVRNKKIGQPITLDVYRSDPTGHGKMIRVTVRPSEWIEPPAAVASARPGPSETAVAGLGLTVHPLSSALAQQFGVSSTQGVLVIAVESNTAAARKGIKAGDVITSVNKQAIANPKQFRDALQSADLKKGVTVKWVSGGTPRVEVLKDGKE